ncbi:MAG: hypothetical protein M3R72_07200 [Bacteroidota bacterium]|nr:hypothetical protein [Bacteroidota bacterium]
MNISLATLFLLVLLYPGFIFRRFYYTEEFSREYFKQTITDLLVAAILPSALLHIAGYFLFVRHRYNIDIVTIGTLLSGTSDGARVTAAFQSIYVHAAGIVSYFIAVSALAAIAGLIAKYIVRKLKLDRKFKLFRFQNEWHYIFSGEILDFPRVPGNADDISIRYIDALVKSDQGTIIYTGILADYVLSKDGGIDRIYLTNVKRRYLKDDRTNEVLENETDERYYYLPGQFFIIPYTQIINLHITYYKIEVTDVELTEELDNISTD